MQTVVDKGAMRPRLAQHASWFSHCGACHKRIGVCAAVRGRPRKTSTDGEAPAAAPKRKPEVRGGKRRGPKPTTSGDHLQLLDPGLLEEFKQIAAAEEAIRQEQPTDDEADPARFNFHRLLMNAASRGLPDQAEEVLQQLDEAGLPPGPRAYHALVFAHVRAKAPDGALAAARTAVEQGLLLLPETFVILIFSVLNHYREPDVETAQQVLESMEVQEQGAGREKGGQIGWLMLCKELFRKSLISEAMQSVKRGYDAKGYVGDAELVAHVVEQLARAGLKDRAYQEVQNLEALGYKPGPQHYNPLIKAEAATGAWKRARYMLIDAFNKPTWSAPNVATFAALLEGLVLSVDPETGLPTGSGVDSDVTDRLSDMAQATQPGAASESAARALADQFTKLREEMLLYGLRLNSECYAAMCSGYIKIRAADEALGTFQSMLDSGGTTRMLSKKKLLALLTMLVEDDRPADLLNVLKGLVACNQGLPRSASKALDQVMPGASLVSAWLPGHFEYMRAHPDDGTGQGAGGSAGFSMRAILEQAMETKETESGVLLSVLSSCAVEDDGSGVWLKPARMTMAQLEAELIDAQIAVPEKPKRSQLVALVKQHRADMPKNVLDIQEHLEARRKAEAEALERKMGISADELTGKKKSSKGKVETKTFRVFNFVEGRVAEVQHVMQEVKKRKAGFTVERSGSDPYGMGDEDDSRPQDDDTDELSDILKDGVDEGVGDILRGDDTIYGDASDILPDSDSSKQLDALEITIDHIEARRLNRTAGMRVAFDILRCVEMLGGSPSGPDYETLVQGVVAESNPDVALELSDRLPRLLNMGYSKEAVAGLYDQLARVCFSTLRGASADLVLEKAEDCELEMDPTLYAMLRKALGDRPRHRDAAAKEMESLTEDLATADLLAKDDVSETLEEEDALAAGGRVVTQPGDADDEDDDDDKGVYGRVPALRPEDASPETEEAEDAVAGSKDSWAAGQIQGPAKSAAQQVLAPLTFGVLSKVDSGLDATDMMALYEDAQSLLAPPRLMPAAADSEGEDEGEAPDVLLGGGVQVSMQQMEALQSALEAGATPQEALMQAGLIGQQDLEGLEQVMAEQELDDSDQQVLSELQELFNEDVMSKIDSLMGEGQEEEEEEQEAGWEAALRQELEPLAEDFLTRGLTDADMSAWEHELNQALEDEARYEAAAREFFLEQAEDSGMPVEGLQGHWDAAKPLVDQAQEEDPHLDQVLEELAAAEDTEDLEERLAALENKAGGKVLL